MDVAELGFDVDTGSLSAGTKELTNLAAAAQKTDTAAANASASLNNAATAAKTAATGAAATSAATTAAAGANLQFATSAQKAAAGMGEFAYDGQQGLIAVNNLFGATTKAATGNEVLASSARVAATAMGQANGAANASVPVFEKAAKAANDNAHAHQAMSTQAMAMQHSVRSSIEMLAMGIAPTQILASQMNHLSYAMSGEGGLAGAASALGTSLKSLLDPINLIGIGLFALSLVFLSFVNWTNLAKGALMDLADILPTIAPYLLGIGAAFAIAFAPQILGLITAVSEAILGLTARLIGLAIGFAAANPLTAFILGFALIVAALNIFRNEIQQALGVDIVGYMKDGVNAIVGGFIGGYEAILATWKQLPAAFADFAIEAANFLISAVQNAVNKVIDSMRSVWNWIAEHDPTGNMKKNTDTSQVDLGQIANPYAGAGNAATDVAKQAFASAQGVDYVGKAYTAIGNVASTAAGKIRDLAKSMGQEDDEAKKKRGKTDAEKFDDIIKGADNTIAKLQAERDALGMTADAAAELKYETQLLNEARSKGIDLSPIEIQQLKEKAAQMADLEIQTKNVKDAMAFAKDITKGFFDDFASGIQQGKTLWESFKDAALNAISKIVDKLLDSLLTSLFQVNAATADGSSFWSALGGMFGLGGGGSSSGGSGGGLADLFGLGFMDTLAKGGAFNQGVKMFASGGVVSSPTAFGMSGGLGVMGEAGPEAIMPLKRMGNGDMGIAAMGGQSANNNQPQPVNLNVNVSGARGNSEIKEMVKQGVQEGISQYDQYALPARVNEIGSDRRVR